MTAPTAAFTADKTHMDVNGSTAARTVQFTDTSTGTPTAWAWDFGDATYVGPVDSVSTLQNPTHIFEGPPGARTISLTVTNGDGTDVETKVDFIHLGSVPNADGAPMGASTGPVPLTVPYMSMGYDGTGPATYLWDFDDGTTSTNKNQTHTYTVPGTYHPSLTVTNPYGTSTDTMDMDVVVAEVPPPPLVAAFIMSPSDPLPREAIEFTDTSAGTPTSWAWDFGEGTTSTEQSPTHAILYPGVYPVTLTVTKTGESISTTQYITVRKAVVYDGIELANVAPYDVDHDPVCNPTDLKDGGISLQGSSRDKPQWSFSCAAVTSAERANLISLAALKGQRLMLEIDGVQYPGTMICKPFRETRGLAWGVPYTISFIQEKLS